MVQIHLPGEGPNPRTPTPIYAPFPAGTELIRIYDPDAHGHPTEYKRWGPTARFDHHRNSPGSPGHDPDRGVYYAALGLAVCVTEVFGDRRSITCANRRVARVRLEHDVHLIDLRGPGAMLVGSVAALSATADRPLSQAWARHLYDHPAIDPPAHGLIYTSAHNAGDALVLFERAGPCLTALADERLDHPFFRAELESIALEHNIVFDHS